MVCKYFIDGILEFEDAIWSKPCTKANRADVAAIAAAVCAAVRRPPTAVRPGALRDPLLHFCHKPLGAVSAAGGVAQTL
jgi:hypothetical protein